MRTEFLVALSASFFAIAFIAPYVAGWLSLIFLFPIFVCVAQQRPLSFRDGFLWGLIFNSVAFWGINNYVIVFANKAWIGALLIPIFLVTIAAAHAGLWFFIAQNTARLFNSNAMRLLSWAMITFTYFYCVHYYFFWFWYQTNLFGISFIHPLLPLAAHPRWIAFIAIVGLWVMVALLICCAACCAMSINSTTQKSRLLWSLGAIVSFAPFCYGWIVQTDTQHPKKSWLAKEIALVPKLKSFYAEDQLKEISDYLDLVTQYHPEINYIISPESILEFPLNLIPRIDDAFKHNLLEKKIQYIFGVRHFDKDKTKRYNSAYHINREQGITIYKKQHLFPFFESVPGWWRYIPGINSLFSTENFYTHGGPENNDVIFSLDSYNHRYFKPYLCSEFFTDSLVKASDDYTILVMSKMGRFIPFFQKQLFLFTHLKAVALQQEIVLVSDVGGWVIYPDGSNEPLSAIKFS